MTWAKLDDQYFRHPKCRAAGKDGRALDVAAICSSAAASTDGFISHASLPLIAAEAEVRPSVAKRLVEVGRWDAVIGGFQIHNYGRWQRSREQVEAERDATASRVRKHRDKQRGNAVTSTVRNGVAGRDVTRQEVEREPDLHQQPCSEPPAVVAVDDDEDRSAGQPLDPVAVKVRAVVDRCATARMDGKTIANRDAYERTVRVEFAGRELELRDVIASHPSAPVSTLAGWMLGEPNSLHTYRDLREAAS